MDSNLQTESGNKSTVFANWGDWEKVKFEGFSIGGERKKSGQITARNAGKTIPKIRGEKKKGV